MKQLLILLLLSSSVHAADYDDPYAKFSTNNNFTTSSKIEWKTSDNIQATCDKLSIQAVGKPFPYKVLACSQWQHNYIFQDSCVIYTSKNTNMLTVGHEVRHCFQGEYHK